MREILFRGKDNGVLNNQWQFGSADFTNEEFPQIIRYDRFGNKMYIPVDRDTVGQFTGLTDMRGNKIFEGDILLSKVYEYTEEDVGWGMQRLRTGNKIDAVWSVEHKIYNAKCGYFVFGKDRRFHIPLTHSVIINGQCRVIGNIHDNPELLGGAK